MKVSVLAAAALLVAGSLFAQGYTRELEGRKLALEEIFYEDFQDDYADWVVEGKAMVRISQGRLEVDARGGAVTIWCRREFEGPQLVEYDVRLAGDSFESNVNFFLLAGNPDAAGLLATSAERDGSYDQYHRFPNYLVTILNGVSPEKREQLRVRLRLDPGFRLVSEGWFEPLVFGRVYHVAYLVEPPNLTVYLDGRRIGYAEYADKITKGLHGLRIWQTHSIYDNFRVSRLVE